MKPYDWDDFKNERMVRRRKVSFKEAVAAIETGQLLDIIDHPNPGKYPGQKIYILVLKNYVHIVPFTEEEDRIVLETIIPSRKFTKRYLSGGKDEKNQVG